MGISREWPGASSYGALVNKATDGSLVMLHLVYGLQQLLVLELH